MVPNTNNTQKTLEKFLVDEFEKLEEFLVNERNNNMNLIQKHNYLRNSLNNLNKKYKTKIKDEKNKNKNLIKEIEQLKIQLKNEINTKNDLIESNQKLNELLNKTKKEFDDYKKEEEIIKRNLQTQLDDKFLKNNQLSNKITNLEKELDEKKLKNDHLIDKNKNLENKLKAENKYFEDYISVLSGEIDKLNKEKDELKKKLEECLSQIKEGKEEKGITIYFNSWDQEIKKYPIKCKSKDNFKLIKDKLYPAFPNFNKENNKFIVNGHDIDESKSLDENRIMNDDVIFIYQVDSIMLNSH